MAKDDRPRWGPAWLAGIAILVLGVIVVLGVLNGGDGTSSAADRDVSTSAANSSELEAECRFVERTSTLRLDGEFATALARAGAEVKVIAPATGSVSRGIVLPIVTSRKVTCPDYGRVIGHRGGVELDLGPARIELRRFRVMTGDGRVEIFTSPRTSVGVSAFRADLDAAIEPNLDNIITLRRVPLTLTAAGAETLDTALRTEAFAAGMPFGLLDVR